VTWAAAIARSTGTTAQSLVAALRLASDEFGASMLDYAAV
jgi:hypothetical protein